MIIQLSQFVSPNTDLLSKYLAGYSESTMESMFEKFIEVTHMSQSQASDYLLNLTELSYNTVLDCCLCNQPAYVSDQTIAHFYMGWYLRR